MYKYILDTYKERIIHISFRVIKTFRVDIQICSIHKYFMKNHETFLLQEFFKERYKFSFYMQDKMFKIRFLRF